jgi:glutamine synthetase
VPGFEAPINLAYSARNRSAHAGIPLVSSPKARRVEVRFPDPTANPYLAFAAMLMAGLDGVQNKIHPGDPLDKNLYDLEPEEAAKVPHPCASLDEALENLDKDREFLTRGGVFTDDMLDAYIALKYEEVQRFRMTTHPIEFEMYLLGLADRDRAAREVLPRRHRAPAPFSCALRSPKPQPIARTARISLILLLFP